MGELLDPNISLPFPVELVIRDTPRSHQSPNSKGKELWKQRVGEAARMHARTVREFYMVDSRPLAVTIYYFPEARMDGDVDNIVKLIVDGMTLAFYPDDRVIERVTVQKFEPGIQVLFRSLTPTLQKAVRTRPPVIYIRIDDDLGWRQVP